MTKAGPELLVDGYVRRRQDLEDGRVPAPSEEQVREMGDTKMTKERYEWEQRGMEFGHVQGRRRESDDTSNSMEGLSGNMEETFPSTSVFEQELETLRAECERLRTERNEEVVRNSDMERRLKRAIDETDRDREALGHFQRENAKLRKEVKNHHVSSSSPKVSKSGRDDGRSDLRGIHDETQRQVHDQRRRIEELEGFNQELYQKHKASKAAYRELESELADKNAHLYTVREKNKTLAGKLRESSKLIEEHVRVLEERQGEVQELKAQLEKAQSMNQMLMAEVAGKVSVEEIRSELAESIKTVNDQRGIIDNQRKEIEQLQAESKRLRESNDTRSRELEDKTTVVEVWRRHVEGLEAQIKESRGDLRKKQRETEFLRGRIKELRDKEEALRHK